METELKELKQNVVFSMEKKIDELKTSLLVMFEQYAKKEKSFTAVLQGSSQGNNSRTTDEGFCNSTANSVVPDSSQTHQNTIFQAGNEKDSWKIHSANYVIQTKNMQPERRDKLYTSLRRDIILYNSLRREITLHDGLRREIILSNSLRREITLYDNLRREITLYDSLRREIILYDSLRHEIILSNIMRCEILLSDSLKHQKVLYDSIRCEIILTDSLRRKIIISDYLRREISLSDSMRRKMTVNSRF